MITKKWLLCPGEVYSKNDRQRHYVSAADLARLYGVDMRECSIYSSAPWSSLQLQRATEELYAGLVRLEPRSDGYYVLPIEKRIAAEVAEANRLSKRRLYALRLLLEFGGLNSSYRSNENMRVCKAVASWISAGADVGDFAGFPTPAPLSRLASDQEYGHAD